MTEASYAHTAYAARRAMVDELVAQVKAETSPAARREVVLAIDDARAWKSFHEPRLAPPPGHERLVRDVAGGLDEAVAGASSREIDELERYFRDEAVC